MAAEPLIYSRFKVTKADGAVIKMRIQVGREQYHEKIVNFLKKCYIPEESFVRCAGVSKNDEALKEMCEFLLFLMDEMKDKAPPLICCIDKDGEDVEIVGCNIFYLAQKGDDPDLEYKTQEVKILFGIFEALEPVYNLYEHFDVDRYLGGAGLGVDPAYRGCGIATELFKARKMLIQEQGIPLSGVWLTSHGSQKAAFRAGYHQVAEIEFEELGKRTGITFDDVPKMCVLCVLKP